MKIFIRLLIVVFMLLLSGAFFAFMVMKKIDESHHVSMVELVVPRGASLNKVAEILDSNNVVSDARLFVLYVRLFGLTNKMKAGEYAFGGDISVKDVAKKIADGDVIVRSITIPEGKTLAEIKNILNNNPYLEGEITLNLKEGDVLPETYHFAKGESRDSVLLKAKKAMQNVLREAFQKRDDKLPIKTEYELLTLASIVEKETGIGAERGKVASVFANRLRIGMRLQTDPTVIYAVTDGKMNLGRPIYKKDLMYDSPYNTYIYAGLPPSPICSPGKAAILAAAHPSHTKYLYFVADGVTGGHRFATTLAEHNRNVALYRAKIKKK